MPVCYLCFINVFSERKLIFHFKRIHKLDANSLYRCREGNCMRDFLNLKTFLKHLRSKHGLSETSSPLNKISDTRKNVQKNITAEINNVEFLEQEKENSIKPCDIEQFKKIIKTESLSFVAKLYDLCLLPRSHIQLFINTISEYLSSGFICILQEVVLKYLEDEDSKKIVSDLFNILQNPFEELRTEHLRFKLFEESSALIRPKQYIIGRQFQDQRHSVDVVGHFVPLRDLFKKVFKTGNILDEVQNYIREVNESNDSVNVSSFLQSAFWQEIVPSVTERHDGVTYIPLFLYFDDYETGNPLSSHSGIHKLGGVYINTPCFPPQYASKLENIFLALLFHSSDRKKFGNEAVFKILLNELKHLEETEIVIDHDRLGNVKLKFIFTLILGDNLGLHSLLGMNESFGAGYHCRFCTVSKSDSETRVVDDLTLHRTALAYDTVVEQKAFNKNGIKEKCIFNDLQYFHITKNYYVDPMHDIAEGVCHYDLIHILKYFIHTVKLFTLSMLNNKIEHFDYGPDKSNKPPLIISDFHLKKKLSMTASEMICFVRYFSLFVGHLIPSSNQVWTFYLHLREIIDIVHARVVNEDLITMLEYHIHQHHTLFINLFNETLKPKFHHLVHYPHIMRKIGPLTRMSAMRYEAKHRESKLTSNISNCRKNLTKTLSLKHQLKVSYRILSNKGFKTEFHCGPEGVLLPECTLLLSHVPQNYFVAKYIEINGINYMCDAHHAIVVCSDNLLLQFGVIKNIVISDSNKVLFLYSRMRTICFSEHYHAYVVEKTNDLNFIEYEQLLDPSILLLSYIEKDYYVTLKCHM